jgi:hypothetical protein
MQWRGFNFLSKSKKDDLMNLLMGIQEALLESGLWQHPRVCFKDNVPSNLVAELSKICQRHKATIVTNEKKATHIVQYSPEVDGFVGQDADYLRTLVVRAANSAVTM